MPTISGYTPPAFDATHYAKSTMKRVDETESRLEEVRTAFEGLTLIKGDKGEAFKVDIFGTVAEILAEKAAKTPSPSPNDVFYAVINDDTINLGRDLFSGIESGSKQDLSRHAIVYNGTVWTDMGPFTGAQGIQGIQGIPGNDVNATAAIIQVNDRVDSVVAVNTAQSTAISNVNTRVDGVVTVNETQTTLLSGLRTDLDAANTSLTAAIDAVDTKVDAAIGVNGTQTTLLSGLRTDLDAANVSLTASIDAVDTKVDAAIGVNGTQTTLLSGLRTDLDASVTVNGTQTNLLSGLRTDLDAATTAQTAAIDAVDTKVDAAIGVNGTQTTLLAGLRTDANTALATNNTQDGLLSGLRTDLDAATTAQTAAIDAVDTKVDAAIGVNGTQTTLLTGLRTDLNAAVVVNTTQSTAIASLVQNSANYLLVEGETTANNEVRWACGAAAPIVDRFGIPVPYKSILYRSSGISYGSHGALQKVTVDVNCYGKTGSATLLKTLEFNLSPDGFLLCAEASAKSLANTLANGGNFLSLGNVIGYNSSNAVISIPPSLRFRVTLEVFKDEQDSGFSLAL